MYLDEVLCEIYTKFGGNSQKPPNINNFSFLHLDEYKTIFAVKCNSTVKTTESNLPNRGLISINEPNESIDGGLKKSHQLLVEIFYDKTICNTTQLPVVNKKPLCNMRTVIVKELCHLALHRDFYEDTNFMNNILDESNRIDVLNYILNYKSRKNIKLNSEELQKFKKILEIVMSSGEREDFFEILNMTNKILNEYNKYKDSDIDYAIYAMQQYIYKTQKDKSYTQNAIENSAYYVHFECLFPIYMRKEFYNNLKDDALAKREQINYYAEKLRIPIDDITQFMNPEFESTVKKYLNILAPKYTAMINKIKY